MYKMIATCPDELVPYLRDEIIEAGGSEVNPSYRAVYFTADKDLYYRAHLQLRLASRLLRVIKEMPANSPTIIFDKTKRIRFGEWFNPEDAVRIEVTTSGQNENMPIDVIGSKVREAITDSFVHFDKATPNLSSRDAIVSLRAFHNRNRLMLSVDTSGMSMHKRGFRIEGHPAPIKETLAATLLRIAGYDGTKAFFDPMCGSGSIVIEAAQIAMNKAPLIHRKKGLFGFEHLKDFDNTYWRKVCDKIRAEQKQPEVPLFGADIDPTHVELARETALAARVEKYITFESKDFFETKKPAEEGLLIANLPYGIRLDEHEIDEAYLRKIGDHIKNNFKGWQCGFILPEAAPYKFFGLKHKKRVGILNGSVACKFILFDIF